MPWAVEKIEHDAWTAKFGEELFDVSRYDPYELTCIIEDRGDGVAYITNAMSKGTRIPNREDLREKLLSLGFTQVRWIRVVDEKL